MLKIESCKYQSRSDTNKEPGTQEYGTGHTTQSYQTKLSM